MRLMTLTDMLTKLREEARISADIAHGSHMQARYISLLERVQEEVYHAYEWPHLQTVQTFDWPANQRYGAYPEQFTLEGIKAIYAQLADGNWRELAYGIGAEELNDVDSDLGETREYPLAWNNYLSPVAEEIHANMLELWPVPNRITKLRFQGKRKLLPLTNPAADASTVDGMIVVLHAAAEILAGNKAEDAALKLQKAQARYDTMKARATSPDRGPIIPNSGGATRPYNHQRFRVR